MNHEGVSLKM